MTFKNQENQKNVEQLKNRLKQIGSDDYIFCLPPDYGNPEYFDMLNDPDYYYEDFQPKKFKKQKIEQEEEPEEDLNPKPLYCLVHREPNENEPKKKIK